MNTRDSSKRVNALEKNANKCVEPSVVSLAEQLSDAVMDAMDTSDGLSMMAREVQSDGLVAHVKG